MQTEVPNAHNGYLDIFLDGGVIGVILLFILLFTAGNRLLRNIDVNRFQRVKFALLIVAIFGGVTESNFGRPSLLWFTTVLAVMDLPSLNADEKLSGNLKKSTAGIVAVKLESETPSSIATMDYKPLSKEII